MEEETSGFHIIKPIRGFLRKLGPGLITGAADDDPSGISTYSIAGASFGSMPLWTCFLTFPLMAGIQLMCARLGKVSGRGLAGNIRLYYPRWILLCTCLVLSVANVFNIGADLGGMAEATEMMTGIKSYYWMPLYTLFIIVMLLFFTYEAIVKIFKWLTLVLFAYILTAFLAKPDWYNALYYTFIPGIEWSGKFFATLVAILGTTISPYLFFWQVSQEVEEDRANGKSTVEQRRGASDTELKNIRTDVTMGMFLSNIIMYFIILTSAATLHAHGSTDISTAREAAEALRPLAGDGAYFLFSLGMIGTGMLAIPVLAGSAAYAVSEALQWRGTLSDRLPSSYKFYLLIVVAMLLGLVLDFYGIDAVKMLFYSAMLNGLLAPPLMVFVILLTSKARVMGTRVSPPTLRYLGWITVALMAGAGIGMFIFQ